MRLILFLVSIPYLISHLLIIFLDPYGVLEEGQIHFRSSEPIINPSTGEQTDIILGDVLVSFFVYYLELNIHLDLRYPEIQQGFPQMSKRYVFAYL